VASQTLTDLIPELLLGAALLSGHPMPAQPPEVVLVTQARLGEMACGRPCRIHGWSPPGNAIYLDIALDLDLDLFAQSILLHELVHYLQQESGKFGRHIDCLEWVEREREAYLAQYRWLSRKQGFPVAIPPTAGPFGAMAGCRAEPGGDNAGLGG
jgi:hypothetical protein